VAISYDVQQLDEGLGADLIVGGQVIVEMKSSSHLPETDGPETGISVELWRSFDEGKHHSYQQWKPIMISPCLCGSVR